MSPTITIPDPSLVLLIGAAGAGKSTFAARQFAPGEVLSSDALRAAIGRGEADQAATSPAFAALHRQMMRRLQRGELTVVDATNVERHARRALVRRAHAAGVPAVAIVLDLPEEVVLARNATRRERVVNPDVVRHHLGRLRGAIDRGALESEGYAAIYRIREPAEVDAATIVRDRAPAAATGPIPPPPINDPRR